jgi:hypothetical protein
MYVQYMGRQQTGREMARIREHEVVYKLATQYFSTVAPRGGRCEMQARLFEAETEFPPYSFLGDAQLLDHARLADCLRQ